MEHFLVISDDVDATRDFYRDVLGMREGFRPELEFPGYWLYLGDVPCIHIVDWEGYDRWTREVDIPMSTRAASTGPLDHIAFNASGYDEVRGKLDSANLPYKFNDLDDIGLKQLFVHDPNGLCIELNFRS
jgi:catechol 2,3-dioxygenase-like lactoylglutathione lyase family enzyme